MGFIFWNNYYFLGILLQIGCILHALKTGRREWLYLLIFLPGIGAIIYLLWEVLPVFRSGNAANNILGFLGGGKIRELERARTIADTESNRLKLAAAYAERKDFIKAIPLAKSCLTGIYANNYGMMIDVARYCFGAGEYEESLSWYTKAIALKDKRLETADDQLLYAQVLDRCGKDVEAEQAYLQVIRMHDSLEGRYHYGMFLKKMGRTEDARTQFKTVLAEKGLHPRHVRRRNARCIMACRKELYAMR